MANGEASLTSLVPPLEGVDPDDSFSSVPYERGMNFLFMLQVLVFQGNGGPYPSYSG
jgi:leukotriene-A4 hydrolase